MEIGTVQWKCTNSHTSREFGWKCLVPYFITPKQKAHFSEEDAKRWRQCGLWERNNCHVFWEHPVMRSFWTDFHQALKHILNIDLPFQFSTLFLRKAI